MNNALVQVELLCKRLEDHARKNTPVDLYTGFRSMAIDIIYSYCFGEPLGALDDVTLNHPIMRGMEAGLTDNWIFKHFPWILAIMNKLPFLLSLVLDPNMAAFHKVRERLCRQQEHGCDTDV